MGSCSALAVVQRRFHFLFRSLSKRQCFKLLYYHHGNQSYPKNATKWIKPQHINKKPLLVNSSVITQANLSFGTHCFLSGRSTVIHGLEGGNLSKIFLFSSVYLFQPCTPSLSYCFYQPYVRERS